MKLDPIFSEAQFWDKMYLIHKRESFPPEISAPHLCHVATIGLKL